MATPSAEHLPSDPITRPRDDESPQLQHASRLLLLVTLIFVLVVVIGLVFDLHQRQSTQKLAEANRQLEEELSQTRGQITALNSRLKALTAPVDPQPTSPPDESWNKVAPQKGSAAALRAPVRRASSATPAWEKQLRRQLAAQKQQLAATQQALAKTRSDFEDNLASTRGNLNDLSGTVARNHSELTALERRGRRDYYEFDLAKSKRPQREGPISIRLRHTSTKHQNYDVDLIVDDVKLTKKHVNLYEPLMFQVSGSPQPLELVVNQIGKDRVHGYVSAPKTMVSRTADAATPAGAVNSNSSAAAPSSPPAESRAVSDANLQ